MKQLLFRHSSLLRLSAVFFIGVLPLSGCGGGSSETPTKSPQSTEAPPPPPPTPATPPPDTAQQPGSIVLHVVLEGEAPARQALEVNKDAEVCGKTEKLSETLLVGANKGIQNAVAYLSGVPGAQPMPVPEHHPVIDQTGCRYEPHVLLVPAGATVAIKNSDGILHNIHTYSEKNPAFNMAQPKFQKVIEKTFERPEIIRVACDVHAWMSAWIVVQEHPYYTITDATGTGRLANVPPGQYTLKLWHETLGEQDTPITVTAGEESTATINLKSGG